MAELSEMIYDRGLRDWELEPAYNATMDDMDLERVNIFLAQRATSGQRSSRFKNIERVLVGMRCAVEVDGTIVPTNAGILFLDRVHRIIFLRVRWRVCYFVRPLGPVATQIAKS